MHLLVRIVFILFVYSNLSDWFLKMFCILFQQFIAPIITEFLPKESALYEGFNLSAEDETVSCLWISEQKINQFLNTCGCRLLIDSLMNTIN